MSADIFLPGVGHICPKFLPKNGRDLTSACRILLDSKSRSSCDLSLGCSFDFAYGDWSYHTSSSKEDIE